MQRAHRKNLKKLTNRKIQSIKVDASLVIVRAPVIDVDLAIGAHRETENRLAIGNRRETDVDRVRHDAHRIATRSAAARRGTSENAKDAPETIVSVRGAHLVPKNPRLTRNLLTMAQFRNFNQS